ncbi:hypothetical protein N8D56_19830 [Devosia sp. A8/3-2]|nr:hypothetical protein N8D56_19830 [Devosia sp. A8/3-2]
MRPSSRCVSCRAEEAISVDGWTELRPSMVEYFACYGAAALAVVLMSAVIFVGSTRIVEPAQMLAAFATAILLGAGAFGIGIGGLFTRVRWNNTLLEHHTAFGKQTSLARSDVRSVRPNWRGITIATHDAQGHLLPIPLRCRPIGQTRHQPRPPQCRNRHQGLRDAVGISRSGR